jgi:hypothetical protein
MSDELQVSNRHEFTDTDKWFTRRRLAQEPSLTWQDEQRRKLELRACDIAALPTQELQVGDLRAHVHVSDEWYCALIEEQTPETVNKLKADMFPEQDELWWRDWTSLVYFKRDTDAQGGAE